MEFLKKSQNFLSSLINKKDIKVLKRLGSDSTIKVCKSDKGHAVVILNKSDFVLKMKNILSGHMGHLTSKLNLS